jgi:hypothetical protein
LSDPLRGDQVSFAVSSAELGRSLILDPTALSLESAVKELLDLITGFDVHMMGVLYQAQLSTLDNYDARNLQHVGTVYDIATTDSKS